MFKPFEQAKMYAQSLKLKNRTEWVMFCKSGKRPNDIPSNPNQIYKEWHGMGDWLGTGRIADQNKVYMPFEESREFVRKLALKSSPQWKAFCKAGMKMNEKAYEYMRSDNLDQFIAERENELVLKIKELIEISDRNQIQTLITPNKLFSNKLAMWQAIESCDNYIHWVDRYFSNEGLRLLIQSVDKSKIKTIKILTSIDNFKSSFG